MAPRKLEAAVCAFALIWAPSCNAFSTRAPLSTSSLDKITLETNTLHEWLLAPERCTFSCVSLQTNNDNNNNNNAAALTLTTTRSIHRGEILFQCHAPAVYSARAAYRDKDMGPRLRDIYTKAGPGFDVVALAGSVAAERIRRFRTREGLGLAPESAGVLVPSEYGGLARWLWGTTWTDKSLAEGVDESLAGTIRQGVDLLLPLLDMTARRAWSGNEQAAATSDSIPSSESPWARRAMQSDGPPPSWSRSELEQVAFEAFALVLKHQHPPPPCFLQGVGTLVPEPFLAEGETTEMQRWHGEADLAMVPWLDAFVDKEKNEKKDVNALVGSPPPLSKGNEKVQTRGCLWCVATKDLQEGERVVMKHPWV